MLTRKSGFLNQLMAGSYVSFRNLWLITLLGPRISKFQEICLYGFIDILVRNSILL